MMAQERPTMRPRLTPEVATCRPSIADTMVTAGVSTPSPRMSLRDRHVYGFQTLLPFATYCRVTEYAGSVDCR